MTYTITIEALLAPKRYGETKDNILIESIVVASGKTRRRCDDKYTPTVILKQKDQSIQIHPADLIRLVRSIEAMQ